jgi:twitching motility protein PilT
MKNMEILNNESRVNQLLDLATQMKASDLHLTVGVPPKVRVNGDLKSLDMARLTPAEVKEMATFLIPPFLMGRFEEEGEVDFSYSIPRVGRYRVNAYHQRGSVAITIRLIGEKIPIPSELGIPESVAELIHKKRGLILVTGPTGSGKSTTLASLIDQINQRYEYNIITLEDPCEYLHSHKQSIVNQREIGTDTKSYGKALVAALREDPDVILIGEMRDLETISTAITAAETGHLVLSTLHTIGAASTIDRIIDVFPPYQQGQITSQLALVLEAVVSQQLVPMVGEKGRKAAFEVMLATPAIRNMIREKKTHQIATAIQTNRKIGMQTMDDALYDLYMNRHIDRERALGYAQDPNSLAARIYR